MIRVESDEATYNLHVMLRLELEIALMEGSLQVGTYRSLERPMRDTLGSPPNDRRGAAGRALVAGMMGYFPTYALATWFRFSSGKKFMKIIPTWKTRLKGRVRRAAGLAAQKIHRHGAKYEPQVLVQKVTGTDHPPAVHALLEVQVR